MFKDLEKVYHKIGLEELLNVLRNVSCIRSVCEGNITSVKLRRDVGECFW